MVIIGLVLAVTRYLNGGDPRKTNAPDGPAPGQTFTATVQRVVDGDTVVLADDRRVRYIGIDTPELPRMGHPADCLARVATQYNEQLVLGKTVTFTMGRETHDRYGRLLAYVYVDHNGERLMVNEALMHAGLAQPLTIAPNDTHRTLFEAAGRDAQSKKVGLWAPGACD